MSLNWNLQKCKDWQSLKTYEEWPITNLMIWSTMILSITEITEKNLPEWVWRMKFLKHIDYAIFSKGDKPYWPDEKDIRKRIGLHTNAGTKPRAAWLRDMVRILSEQVDRTIHFEKEDARDNNPSHEASATGTTVVTGT